MYVAADLFQDSDGTELADHLDSYGQSYSVLVGTSSDLIISYNSSLGVNILTNNGSGEVLVKGQAGDENGYTVYSYFVHCDDGYNGFGAAICIDTGPTYYRTWWRDSDHKWVIDKVISGSVTNLGTLTPDNDQTDPRSGSTGGGFSDLNRWPNVIMNWSKSGANDVLVVTIKGQNGSNISNTFTISSSPIHSAGYGGHYDPGSLGHSYVRLAKQFNNDGQFLREFPAPVGYTTVRSVLYNLRTGPLNTDEWTTPASGTAAMIISGGGGVSDTGSAAFAINIDGDWGDNYYIQAYINGNGSNAANGIFGRYGYDPISPTFIAIGGQHEGLFTWRGGPLARADGDYTGMELYAISGSPGVCAEANFMDASCGLAFQPSNMDYESTFTVSLGFLKNEVRFHVTDDGVLGDIVDNHIAPMPPIRGYWSDGTLHTDPLIQTESPNGPPGVFIQDGSNPSMVYEVRITQFEPIGGTPVACLNRNNGGLITT